MSPRTVDMIVATALLLVGLVPIAWPGTGPTLVGLLLRIAGVIGQVIVARA